MARKPRRKGKGLETPESPGGATGRGPERQGEEGRLRGLVRYPPGSNGGVHRGPDRQLRINAVRSLLLEALAKEGARLIITETGRRRHRSKIPMALVTNLVTRIQNIAFTGSDGDVLRLVFGMHEVFQPGKDEKNGNGHGGPRPATFVMAQPEPAPEESGQPPAQATTCGTLLGPDGQEYASG